MQSPETSESGQSALRRITPVQWLGLAALGLLLAYQLGLFNGSGLLGSNPATFVPFLVAIVLAVTVHEFSHALVATLFGDPLPKSRGRLSLNPLAHLDPMGSLVFLVAGFGWGKPVPINPNAMRNPGVGWALTSAAGPFSNFLAALVAAAVWRLSQGSVDASITSFLVTFIRLNVSLGVFNLVPLPPLDGFGFVFGLAPTPLRRLLAPIGAYGPWILMALVFLPEFAPGFPPLLSNALSVVTSLILRTLYAAANGF